MFIHTVYTTHSPMYRKKYNIYRVWYSHWFQPPTRGLWNISLMDKGKLLYSYGVKDEFLGVLPNELFAGRVK